MIMNIKVGNIIEYNNERYYVAYIDNDNSGKIIAYKCREDSEEAGNLIPIFILSNNYGLDYTKSYQIDINNKKNEISIIGTVDDNFISWFNGIIDQKNDPMCGSKTLGLHIRKQRDRRKGNKDIAVCCKTVDSHAVYNLKTSDIAGSVVDSRRICSCYHSSVLLEGGL